MSFVKRFDDDGVVDAEAPPNIASIDVVSETGADDGTLELVDDESPSSTPSSERSRTTSGRR